MQAKPLGPKVALNSDFVDLATKYGSIRDPVQPQRTADLIYWILSRESEQNRVTQIRQEISKDDSCFHLTDKKEIEQIALYLKLRSQADDAVQDPELYPVVTTFSALAAIVPHAWVLSTAILEFPSINHGIVEAQMMGYVFSGLIGAALMPMTFHSVRHLTLDYIRYAESRLPTVAAAGICLSPCAIAPVGELWDALWRHYILANDPYHYMLCGIMGVLPMAWPMLMFTVLNIRNKLMGCVMPGDCDFIRGRIVAPPDCLMSSIETQPIKQQNRRLIESIYP